GDPRRLGRCGGRGRGGGARVSTTASLAGRVEALVGDLTSIRAPRGIDLNARQWSTEAPLRMLLNNLDAEVAEKPEELVVYGGSGRAARSHEALRAIVASLLELRADETLLVQSGKPVGVFTTHEGAPRVLIAHSRERCAARPCCASRSIRTASSGGSRRGTSTKRRIHSTTHLRASVRRRPPDAHCRSGSLGMRRRSCRRSRRVARPLISSPTRP